jgi:hypothetical protein
MPVLLELLKALGIGRDSGRWRAFMSAAAVGRLESLHDPSGILYMPYENTLHGVPEKAKVHRYTVIEAATELGRVQEKLGIKKIMVEACDGSEFVFPIQDRPDRDDEPGGGKQS